MATLLLSLSVIMNAVALCLLASDLRRMSK